MSPIDIAAARHARVTLRRATTADAYWLDLWDRDTDVIACSTDDPNAKIAFDDVEWREELAAQDELSQYFIGELDGRPIGAMQICDPHLETSHYWGDIAPNLRAIDIWIGAPQPRRLPRPRAHAARLACGPPHLTASRLGQPVLNSPTACSCRASPARR